jgi:hypothetical protein
MSKLLDIIRQEQRQAAGAEIYLEQGPAQDPLVLMRVFVKPVLSPTRDRIVGSRQSGGDCADPRHQRRPHLSATSRVKRPRESFQAFEKRVKAAAEASRRCRADPMRRPSDKAFINERRAATDHGGGRVRVA